MNECTSAVESSHDLLLSGKLTRTSIFPQTDGSCPVLPTFCVHSKKRGGGRFPPNIFMFSEWRTWESGRSVPFSCQKIHTVSRKRISRARVGYFSWTPPPLFLTRPSQENAVGGFWGEIICLSSKSLERNSFQIIIHAHPHKNPVILGKKREKERVNIPPLPPRNQIGTEKREKEIPYFSPM